MAHLMGSFHSDVARVEEADYLAVRFLQERASTEHTRSLINMEMVHQDIIGNENWTLGGEVFYSCLFAAFSGIRNNRERERLQAEARASWKGGGQWGQHSCGCDRWDWETEHASWYRCVDILATAYIITLNVNIVWHSTEETEWFLYEFGRHVDRVYKLLNWGVDMVTHVKDENVAFVSFIKAIDITEAVSR